LNLIALLDMTPAWIAAQQDWRRRIGWLLDIGADEPGSPAAEQLKWHIAQFRNVRESALPDTVTHQRSFLLICNAFRLESHARVPFVQTSCHASPDSPAVRMKSVSTTGQNRYN